MVTDVVATPTFTPIPTPQPSEVSIISLNNKILTLEKIIDAKEKKITLLKYKNNMQSKQIDLLGEQLEELQGNINQKLQTILDYLNRER